MSDLAPSVEKERVSNYDPNKKQYVRQNDPERAARTRRNKTVNISGGLDDDVVRGKRKKKQASAPRPEPVNRYTYRAGEDRKGVHDRRDHHRARPLRAHRQAGPARSSKS